LFVISVEVIVCEKPLDSCWLTRAIQQAKLKYLFVRSFRRHGGVYLLTRRGFRTFFTFCTWNRLQLASDTCDKAFIEFP